MLRSYLSIWALLATHDMRRCVWSGWQKQISVAKQYTIINRQSEHGTRSYNQR